MKYTLSLLSHYNLSYVFRMKEVNPSRGKNCSVIGCSKRIKNKAGKDENESRSDSDGTDDEETEIKRLYPRTFRA